MPEIIEKREKIGQKLREKNGRAKWILFIKKEGLSGARILPW